MGMEKEFRGYGNCINIGVYTQTYGRIAMVVTLCLPHRQNIEIADEQQCHRPSSRLHRLLDPRLRYTFTTIA
jgi:hypothetical protein